jgi:hypothetical protein
MRLLPASFHNVALRVSGNDKLRGSDRVPDLIHYLAILGQEADYLREAHNLTSSSFANISDCWVLFHFTSLESRIALLADIAENPTSSLHGLPADAIMHRLWKTCVFRSETSSLPYNGNGSEENWESKYLMPVFAGRH